MSPRARVRTGLVLSSAFDLHRGTRQGCPLSPALFALAVEPMAILLGSSSMVRGISIGPVEEKMSLYVDDTRLYLSNATTSLREALLLIDLFGTYLGICINWGKSVLFALHSTGDRLPTDTPLQIVSQFKYLGVIIHKDTSQFIPLNLAPAMSLLTQRCAAWKMLPLTPVGRVNLIKMSVLSKFVYLFRQTPVPIPRAFFDKLDSVLLAFIWNGGTPRIAKTTLHLPITLGGLALPCFVKYYWAAVLVTVRWWLAEEPANPAATLEVALFGSYLELRNLIHRGPKCSPHITPSMRTTLRVWETVKAKVEQPNSWSPWTPLWGNPRLPHFRSILDPMIWARYGVKTLADITSASGLCTFDVLKRDRGVPNHMFFRYLQLRHAYRAQFPFPITLETNRIEHMLSLEEDLKPLSVVYSDLAGLDTSKVTQLFSRWQTHVPSLAGDDWEEGIQQYLSLMISARDRFTQLKFLHRAYYTPERLAKIYPAHSPLCPKCSTEVGSFIHVTWSCQCIQSFWDGVLQDINSISKLHVTRDPILLLLGIVDRLETTQSKKLFVFMQPFTPGKRYS